MKFWGTIFIILIIDQLSKLWVSSTMILGGSRMIIDGIFSLTYSHNQGAAFGILQGQSWFFLTMAMLVVLSMIFYNFKYSTTPWLQYAMGLVVGGSLGNMIDRLFYGSVRDFFSIGWWPIFNIADMAIVSGGALLMLYILKNDTSSELQL